MSELIDRDVLKREIKKSFDQNQIASLSIAAEFFRILCNVPNVDAEPVRHGRWVPWKTNSNGTNYGTIIIYKCSECRRISYQLIGWGGNMDLEYCPHCGIRMR